MRDYQTIPRFVPPISPLPSTTAASKQPADGPEKFTPYGLAYCQYYDQLCANRRRAAETTRRRVWIYLALAVCLALAFAAFHQNEEDEGEEPLYFSPKKTHFLDNRERLFTVLSEKVPDFSDTEAKTVVLLPGSLRPIRAQSDSEYQDWRQASNVLYVLGEFPIADSLVVLAPRKHSDGESRFDAAKDKRNSGHGKEDNDDADGNEEDPKSNVDVHVFLPALDARTQVFTGALPSAEVLKRQNKVTSVAPIDIGFAEALEPGTTVLVPVSEKEVWPVLGEEVIQKCADRNITIEYSFEVKEAFVEARFVKSERELDMIKYASKMSAQAHKKLENYLQKKKRISEIELASYFRHQTVLRKLSMQAYPPIVGAGEHAAVLHYRGENLTSAYAPIAKNKFVLVDAAGEYHGYSSDITRTITRKKHWSKEMKEVYNIVKKVQQLALDRFEEGVSWLDLGKTAREALVKELWKHEFIVGDDLQTLLDSGVHSVFMPHSLGHPVGLDVHDPIPAKFLVDSEKPGQSRSAVYLQEVSQRSPCSVVPMAPPTEFAIFRGFAATVEPGVYFIPLLFDMVLNDPDGPGRYINWAKISKGKYFELGGVRIEDVVIIDQKGRKEIVSRHH